MIWTKKVSIVLVLITVVVLGVWAIIMGANDTPGDEISVVLLEWASWWKTVPLAFGILMGHWFWPVDKIIFGSWRYLVLVGLVVISLLSDFFVSYVTLFPLIPLVTGIFLGHFLWPQRVRKKS